MGFFDFFKKKKTIIEEIEDITIKELSKNSFIDISSLKCSLNIGLLLII
jgi:hypothetical protein